MGFRIGKNKSVRRQRNKSIGPDEFGGRMEALIAGLKSAPLAANANEILYPGELEVRRAAENLRSGLLLPEQTVTDLQAMLRELGLAPGLLGGTIDRKAD